jgi:chromosome segregation ATPase
VVDLPSSNDIIEGLLAENAALKSVIEADAARAQDKLALADAALGDANAEIARLRETLAAQTAEIADGSRQIEELKELLEAGRGEVLTLTAQRDSLEARLVDSERTRAAVEAQRDEARVRISELSRRRLDRKLWQVFTRPARNQALNTAPNRVFVIADSITEAISRAVEEHKIQADDISNVVEFKTDVLIV